MGRRAVVLSADAELEARAAFSWYVERNRDVALQLEAELTQTIESLQEAPFLGAEIGDGLRRVLLRHFPYGLIYSLEADRLVIVAVMHLRRRPEYWKGR